MHARRLDRPAPLQRLRELPEVVAALLRLADWRLTTPPWPGFPQPYAGQWARRVAIEELAACFRPDVVVETGTFLGITTKHLAGLGSPVHTVEIKPAYYHLARLNLRGTKDVSLVCGRSVDALHLLGSSDGIRRPLAYLDAHWWAELPLKAEVDYLLSQWDDVLIVVDDCRVPDDDGYGYDVYDGVAISLAQLEVGTRVVAAYPAVPAVREGGARRGTLYLAQGSRARSSLVSAVGAGHLRLADAANAAQPAGGSRLGAP